MPTSNKSRNPRTTVTSKYNHEDEGESSIYLANFDFESPSSDSPNTDLSNAKQTIKRKPVPLVSGPDYQTLPGEHHDFFLRHWWLEIFTCFLMLGMLFAIVGILYQHQGYPLPRWPIHISINAAVSVLATILKIAMLFILSQGLSQLKWQWFMHSRPLQDLACFDAASRGPWGCLRLLASLKVLHPVASWGAILVILSIAIDPFVQQLIHYVNCLQVKPNASASIPRASLYAEAGVHTAPGIWPPATPVLAYVNQGIYSPANVQTPFSCSTGNCTFDGYFRTLGYCATCEDLTGELKIQEVNITNGGTFVNTTLPSGTYASFQYNGNTFQSWFTMNYTGDWIEIVLAASLFPGSNLSYADDHYISSILRGKSEGESGCITTYDNNTWACSNTGIGAARCRFDPCVKTYRANVSQSRLQEELIDTNLNMFVGMSAVAEYTYLMADLGCAGTKVVEQLQKAGYHITDPTGLIPWNVGIDDSVINSTSYINSTSAPGGEPNFYNISIPGPLNNGTVLPLDIVPAKCIYQMEYQSVYSLNNYLIDTLYGSIEPSQNFDGVNGPTAVRAIFNDSYVNFDTVNFTFQAIAESITLRIREYGEPPLDQYKEPVTGVTWEMATCVEVKWAFFIFPAVLTALTVLLLIAVILQTEIGEAKNKAQGWKASLWPIVFQELIIQRSIQDEAEITKEGTRETMLKGMDKLATYTHAQLRATSEYR